MRVLFSGYAPVHFLCFRPLYERLLRLPGVEIWLSGGLRSESETGYVFDGPAMYEPLGVDTGKLLTVDEMREQEFDLVFGANTKILKPHNAGVTIQIFHGISFRNRAVRSANLDHDHYFIIGPYMRRAFARAGLMEQDDPRALNIGFMKTDALLNGSLKREDVLAHHGLDGQRPVLAYCPTGQQFNSLETMGEEVLRRLGETDEYDVLVKLHDHPHGEPVDWAARLAPLLGERIKLVNDLDVMPVLFLADLLITDASSVSSEYSLLDRPMVFLDVPELLARAARKEESMLDEKTWGRRAGTIVERAEDVVQHVATGLKEPGRNSETRRAMSADLFYNPGRAVPAAVEWLSERFGIDLPVDAGP